MRTPGSAVLLLVVVSFGLMGTVPGVDCLETAYDEAKGLTYQLTDPVEVTLSDMHSDPPAVPAAAACLMPRSIRAQSYTTCQPPMVAVLCSLRL
jgi:hypothetical protein